MSEKIVAGNLDEVISKNAEICDEMREKAVLIRTNLNRSKFRNFGFGGHRSRSGRRGRQGARSGSVKLWG